MSETDYPLNCDNCKEKVWQDLWRVKGYAIKQCRQCGLIFTDVSETDVEGAYEFDYYKFIYPDYESDRHIHNLNNARLLEEIEELRAPGSLIEIGSAFGFFLSAAQQRGWHTTGYETSSYASSVAKNKYHQNVKIEDFLTAKFDGQVDVVCLLDTLEHLLRPSEYIGRIRQALRDNGLLIITTGDISSPFARACGRRWRMIVPPLHVYYYTRKTITALLEATGFRVISIRSQMKYQNLNSILQHQFGVNKRMLPSIPIPVNLGDIMLIKAVKKPQ